LKNSELLQHLASREIANAKLHKCLAKGWETDSEQHDAHKAAMDECLKSATALIGDEKAMDAADLEKTAGVVSGAERDNAALTPSNVSKVTPDNPETSRLVMRYGQPRRPQIENPLLQEIFGSGE
jgi:hypothetical protein